MSYAEIVQQIRLAEKRAGRAEGAVRLVAVSKKQPVERVQSVLAAGHRLFGENRVQEAEERWTALKPAYDGVELRLIGPLQTNKVKAAIRLFDAIDSVDREKLAVKLASEAQALGRCPDVMVQVNTGEEAQKAGVAPGAVDALLHRCRTELDLPVTGLMAIPPVDEPPGPHFALLAKLAERNGLSELSMGMSADFDEAIALGATLVRVGSGVFGARPAPQAATG